MEWKPRATSWFSIYPKACGLKARATCRFPFYLQVCGWKPHVACGSPVEPGSPLQRPESSGKLLNLNIVCKQLQVIATCNIIFNLKASCISFIGWCKRQYLFTAIYRTLKPTIYTVGYLYDAATNMYCCLTIWLCNNQIYCWLFEVFLLYLRSVVCDCSLKSPRCWHCCKIHSESSAAKPSAFGLNRQLVGGNYATGSLFTWHSAVSCLHGRH